MPNLTTVSSTPATTRSLRRARVPAAAAALLLALAACGDDGGSTGTAPTTTPPASVTTPPATTTAPAATTTTRRPPTSTASGKPTRGAVACAANQLAVSAGHVEGAAGSRFVPIVFRNRSSRTCLMRGYPAVAGLDPAGKVVAHASQTGGAQQTVVVRPGAAASSLVRAAAVPSGDATCPPDYAALRVSPPGQSAATTLAVSLPACGGLEVRPVAAGTTGG
jgi:hypothetical protein